MAETPFVNGPAGGTPLNQTRLNQMLTDIQTALAYNLTIGTVSSGPTPAASITGAAPNQALNLTFGTGTDFGYLYAGFMGNGSYLEKMSLHFAPDGKSVQGGGNNPVYTDPNTGASFRDPSFLKIGSYWYCAYTVNNGYSKNFGIIRSTDLVNWTDTNGVANQATLVDVSAATSINQAWAPELVQDTNGDVYVFFTNVTATNAQSVWRIKANDLSLGTWAGMAAISWTTNPGNIWDPCFIKVGATWYMFYAITGGPQRATATSLTGTWTTDKTGDWAGWTAASPANTHFEAPEILQLNSSPTYRIYMDRYVGTSPYTFPGYCYSESSDLVTWSAPVTVAKGPDFPVATTLRHGAWVKLADTQSMLTALSATMGGDALRPHVEYSGTFTCANATVTNIGNPAIVAANTNNDQFVTPNGSGLYTFLAAGEYDIQVSFQVTTGSGVTRTFAELATAAGVTIARSPGGAEDTWQLDVVNYRATAGQQILLRAFQSSTGVSPATITDTVRITRRGR